MVQVIMAPWPSSDCPNCGGLGVRGGYDKPCPHCKGTGEIRDDHRFFPVVETATTEELLVLRRSTDKAILPNG